MIETHKSQELATAVNMPTDFYVYLRSFVFEDANKAEEVFKTNQPIDQSDRTNEQIIIILTITNQLQSQSEW